jgi:hypothetical protein
MNLSRGQRLVAASHVVSAISKSSTPACLDDLAEGVQMVNGVPEMGAGLHWTFNTSNLGIHEQRHLKRPADDQHILFGEDQLGQPLPVLPRLPFRVHRGDVFAPAKQTTAC